MISESWATFVAGEIFCEETLTDHLLVFLSLNRSLPPRPMKAVNRSQELTINDLELWTL